MDIFITNVSSAVMIFYIVMTAGCSMLIVYTDIAFYWIPDKAVAFLAVCNGMALFCGWIHPHEIVTIVVATFFCLLYAAKSDSMGSGDVKLVLALCLGCTGWGAYFMILIAFFTALISSLILRVVKGTVMIPFGPYLLAGWWLAWGYGKEMEQWLVLL